MRHPAVQVRPLRAAGVQSPQSSGDSRTIGTTAYRRSSRGPVPVPAHNGRTRTRGGRRRGLRRLLVAAVALLVAAAAGFGVLLLVTPNVTDAPARAAANARFGGYPLLSGPAPVRVQQALVATEDSRFYSHSGVDGLGSARALFGPLLGQPDPGGATLDQQLAKLLYSHGQRTFTDQVEQVVLAVKIDHHFSKAQILRLYLDSAYFGHGNTGITAAAHGYFGRRPQDLSWGQASLLAGLVQAPSAYDPVQHYALARSRQQHVLDRLVATHVLSRAQADAVYRAPLNLLR